MIELFKDGIGSESAERSEQTIYNEAEDLIKQGGVRRLIHVIAQLQSLAQDEVNFRLYKQMEQIRSTKVYCSDGCRKKDLK